MPRIVGVNIPVRKHILIGLQAIYGIGSTRARLICKRAQIDPETKVKDLAEDQLNIIRKEVSKCGEIEGDLRRMVAMNIKRLTDIACYRGLRHRRNLPVRGQRTRTNSRTRRKQHRK